MKWIIKDCYYGPFGMAVNYIAAGVMLITPWSKTLGLSLEETRVVL